MEVSVGQLKVVFSFESEKPVSSARRGGWQLSRAENEKREKPRPISD